jgi:hypothetical protein
MQSCQSNTKYIQCDCIGELQVVCLKGLTRAASQKPLKSLRLVSFNNCAYRQIKNMALKAIDPCSALIGLWRVNVGA